MKLLLDVAKLEADGTVTAQQAEKIRRMAAGETTALAINVLSALGVFAIVGGVVALEPTTIVTGILGAGLAGVGIFLRQIKADTFGFLGGTMVLIGALLHCGAVLVEWEGNWPSFAYCTVVLLALGTILKNSFLIALSVFSIAALLGSTTGYWHASYGLWVEEPTITIFIFSFLAFAAYVISKYFEGYHAIARVFALLSVIWINFGFWVGSLWGDYPAASWMRPDLLYSDRSSELSQWYDHTFFIPEDFFAVIWAIALISLGTWAAIRNQRAVVNAATTFAAIHFYTQWFERLEATPEMGIASGVIAVVIASILWRYNRTESAGDKWGRKALILFLLPLVFVPILFLNKGMPEISRGSLTTSQDSVDPGATDGRVCDMAIRPSDGKWEQSPTFSPWVYEARDRGFKPKYCVKLLAGLDAFERGDYLLALQEFRSLARLGSAEVQYHLGIMYENGLGVSQDYAEAIKWYRLAAEQGDADAQYNLGIMYGEGNGVPQDYSEALEWFRLAIEQGDVDAKNNAAWILATVPDPELRNGVEALRLAQQAVHERADATYLDTLAAAYAEAGQFELAVNEQQRAIEMLRVAGEHNAVADLQSRLDLYRRRQPYRAQ